MIQAVGLVVLDWALPRSHGLGAGLQDSDACIVGLPWRWDECVQKRIYKPNTATGIKQPMQNLRSGIGNAVFGDDALMGIADPCCI